MKRFDPTAPAHGDPPPGGEGETRRVLRWRGGEVDPHHDELAPEEPLEIRVRGRSISVTMRTPGHDDELAVGFLFTEGIINRREDVIRIEPCDREELGNIVNIVLAPTVPIDFDRLTRHVFAASSCGLCGKTTIESIRTRCGPVESDVTIGHSALLAMPQRMLESQLRFQRSGGVHAAALFDSSGTLLVVREDVGRHNAVDKLVGQALLSDRLPLDRHVLLVSGRASFEIVQKALAARVPIVAAVSAPSTLAVDFAESNGQTLIGFLREGRMNVYSHPHRITGFQPVSSKHGLESRDT
jgi:FdhD protein